MFGLSFPLYWDHIHLQFPAMPFLLSILNNIK